MLKEVLKSKMRELKKDNAMQNTKRVIKRNYKALNPYYQRLTYSLKLKGLSGVILCQILKYLDTKGWLVKSEEKSVAKDASRKLELQYNLLKGTARILMQ